MSPRWVDPRDRSSWDSWLAAQSPRVQQVARRFNPWQLYRIRGTPRRVTIRAFEDNPDDRVSVSGRLSGAHNRVLFDRTLYGIDPDDLEPCEPPEPGEVTGTLWMRLWARVR